MDWSKLFPKERKKLKRISLEKNLAAMDEALWGQTSHPLTGIWDSVLTKLYVSIW